MHAGLEHAPTFAVIAVIASELTGREVTVDVLDEDEWLAVRVAADQPETMMRFLLGMYRAAAQGFFAGTDPQLGALLGRRPQTVRDLLAQAMPTGH